MDDVVDIQVIQAPDDRLRVLVVQRGASDGRSARDRIAAILDELAGPPELPQVERVQELALTPGGKVRTLIVEPSDGV
jgi:hypothetical protein